MIIHNKIYMVTMQSRTINSTIEIALLLVLIMHHNVSFLEVSNSKTDDVYHVYLSLHRNRTRVIATRRGARIPFSLRLCELPANGTKRDSSALGSTRCYHRYVQLHLAIWGIIWGIKGGREGYHVHRK